MKYRFLSAAVIALAVATIVACGKSSPTTPSNAGTTSVSNPGTPGSSTGRLTVSLKDSPFVDATAVLVTLTEVSAHHSGGSWFPVAFDHGATQLICDLKKLEKSQDFLGIVTLDAGHYTQIRLTVSSARLYFDQTTPTGACFDKMPTMVGTVDPKNPPADLNIPSGELKLNRPFDVGGGATVNMLLDFDGDKSIHMLGNGKYQMSPVISVVSVQ